MGKMRAAPIAVGSAATAADSVSKGSSISGRISHVSSSEKMPPGIRRADFLRGVASVGIAAGVAGKSVSVGAQGAPPQPGTGVQTKPATRYTSEINARCRQALRFDDTMDFGDARRGLIASLPGPVVIRNDRGAPIWDLTQYAFIGTGAQDDAPDTVNPSLCAWPS